ncbi:MAG TPA: type VI secretion system tube protein Hcp [Candidatus Aquilonibacter sp.]|nr:type VI secretion system tube protein Hcp [Candidatus Aquilonibacter sp.]
MAVSAYLKIDGLDGESLTKGKEKQIEVLSFSFGASQHITLASGGGKSGGKATATDLSIMKKVDKASPKLFSACCMGTGFPTATITCDKAMGSSGQQDFYKLILTNAFVSSIQWSGSSDVPMESVSFTAEKVEIDYAADSADNKSLEGFVTAYHDFAKSVGA